MYVFIYVYEGLTSVNVGCASTITLLAVRVPELVYPFLDFTFSGSMTISAMPLFWTILFTDVSTLLLSTQSKSGKKRCVR